MASFYHNYSDYAANVSSLQAGGDDYQERVQLENTIHLPDISFSTVPSDVEYPRHLPDPHLARSYDSGIYGNLDVDDEDADHYSVSTIHHHVNGVTLSPGLVRIKPQFTPTTSDFDASRPLSRLDLRQAKQDSNRISHSNLYKNAPSPARVRTQARKLSAKSPRSQHDKENLAPSNRAIPKVLRTKDYNTGQGMRLPDITGITAGVTSPVKSINPSHLEPPSQLHTVEELQRRLLASTEEIKFMHRRVGDLENELKNCRNSERQLQYRLSHGDVDPGSLQKLEEVRKEKEALTSLVDSLRNHNSRLKRSLEERSAELDRLRTTISEQQATISNLRAKLSYSERTIIERESLDRSRSAEIERLRTEISHLEAECNYLRGCVERGLSNVAGQPTVQSKEGTSQNRPWALNRGLTPVTEVTEPSAEQLPISYENHAETPVRPKSRTGDTSKAAATYGGSSTKTARFIDDNEMSRLQVDLSERRSERSHSSHSYSLVNTNLPVTNEHGPAVTVTKYSDVGGNNPRPRTPEGMKAGPSNLEKSQPRRRSDASTAANTKEDVHLSKSRGKDRKSPITPAFPQIRGEAAERLFFSAPPHNERTCSACNKKKDVVVGTPDWLRRFKSGRKTREEESDPVNGLAPEVQHGEADQLPPQTVLTKVLRELDDDFTHYKSIYCELADQYKIIDAASNVAKRNVLAEHLTEVIKVLEKKGDQIASLYRLLSFKDQPTD